MKIYHVGGSALILAIVVCFWRGDVDDMPSGNTAEESPQDRQSNRNGRAERMMEQPDHKAANDFSKVNPATNERRRELARLKKAWLSLGAGDGDMEKRDVLQAESIDVLMCSMEMLELSKFLEDQGIRIGSSGGELAILAPLVFSGPKADLAKTLLLDALPNLPVEYVDRWCESAGKRLDPSGFDDFVASLAEKSRPASTSAVFGRSLLLAKTNPNAAVADFLESIDSSIEEQDQMNALRLGNLVEIRFLPPGTDFEALAEVLEAHDPGGKRFGFARETFFKSWGRFDPAGAANHIMAKPEVYPPELVAAAASQATGDLESALQWVQMFPEGAYRDAAAEGCADLLDLSDPGGAKRFLPLIRDAEVRARVLANIEGVEKLRASGEPY